MEKRFDATNAHTMPTEVRFAYQKETGMLGIWLGKRQGKDYPRLALLGPDQLRELRSWIIGLR